MSRWVSALLLGLAGLVLTVAPARATVYPGSCRVMTNASDSTPIANTAGEQSFDRSMFVPGGLLNTAGTTVHLLALGVYSTTGSPTLRLSFWLGSNRIADFQTTGHTDTTNWIWQITGSFAVRTTGASASVVQGPGWGAITYGNVMHTTLMTHPMTVDLTAGHAIAAAVQWGTQSPSNTATLRDLVVLICVGTGTF